jgi:predicted DsbA family dithiol-disulfide isomerase
VAPAVVDLLEGEVGSDEGRDVVLRGDAAARQGGISGVPSFLMGGDLLFSGALPAEQMAEAFAQAWQVLSTRAA